MKKTGNRLWDKVTGELAPEDPVDGSEASAGRLDRGKHVEHIEAPTHVSVTRSDSRGDHSRTAIPSVEEPDAPVRARLGLWDPWRVWLRKKKSCRSAPVSPSHRHGQAGQIHRNAPVLQSKQKKQSRTYYAVCRLLRLPFRALKASQKGYERNMTGASPLLSLKAGGLI